MASSKEKQKQNYLKHRSEILTRLRLRYTHDPEFRERKKVEAAAWAEKNPEGRKQNLMKYNKKSQKEIAARRVVNNRIRDGHIEKESCIICGHTEAEAHHADYSKPLEIQWLCRKHHAAWHTVFVAER